jgi:hypothetical protein
LKSLNVGRGQLPKCLIVATTCPASLSLSDAYAQLVESGAKHVWWQVQRGLTAGFVLAQALCPRIRRCPLSQDQAEGSRAISEAGLRGCFLEGTALQARGVLITALLVEHGRGRGEICTLALLTAQSMKTSLALKPAFQERESKFRLINRPERPTESI